MSPIVFVLALLAPHADLPAASAAPVVLRIVNMKVAGKGVQLKLRSGRTVRISVEDYDVDLSRIVQKSWAEAHTSETDTAETGTAQPTEEPAANPGDLPNELPMGQIRAKCATEWPDDFRMRKYCEDRQIKAFEELRAR